MENEEVEKAFDSMTEHLNTGLTELDSLYKSYEFKYMILKNNNDTKCLASSANYEQLTQCREPLKIKKSDFNTKITELFDAQEGVIGKCFESTIKAFETNKQKDEMGASFKNCANTYLTEVEKGINELGNNILK